MIELLMLLLSFELNNIKLCEPPCYVITISTDPASYECFCPVPPRSGELLLPGEITYDGSGVLPSDLTISFDPPEDDDIEWEVKQLGEWLCIRQPKREEK